MVYKFVETEEKTLVKNGETVHLECYPGQVGTTGMAEVGGDMSNRPGAWSWDNEDTKFARHLGYWAIRKVRSSLPWGALNQTMTIAGKRQYLTPKKTLLGKEQQLAPKKLASCAESFFSAYVVDTDKSHAVDDPENPAKDCKKEKHEGACINEDSGLPHKILGSHNFVLQMAARDLAARLVGGGVCSLISHVTMGVLTTGCPEGTEAAIVYSNFDHSFCVLRYKTSPWMAVDPWVQRPYVLPMKNVMFHWGSLQNNFRIVIKKKVDVPFGVTFGGDAGVAKDELRVPEAHWQATARRCGIVPWAKRDPKASPKPIDYDDSSYKPVTDVEAELLDGGAACDNYFHMSDTKERHFVWNHVDNIWWPRQKKKGRGCRAKLTKPYGEPNCQPDCCDHGDPDVLAGHLDGVRPAVGPSDWGDPSKWTKPQDIKTLREFLG